MNSSDWKNRSPKDNFGFRFFLAYPALLLSLRCNKGEFSFMKSYSAFFNEKLRHHFLFNKITMFDYLYLFNILIFQHLFYVTMPRHTTVNQCPAEGQT